MCYLLPTFLFLFLDLPITLSSPKLDTMSCDGKIDKIPQSITVNLRCKILSLYLQEEGLPNWSCLQNFTEIFFSPFWRNSTH